MRRANLTAALEARRAVRPTLMRVRVMIHVVSARDFWPLTRAVGEARRSWRLVALRRQIGGTDTEAVAAPVRARLADGPRRQAELRDALVGLASRSEVPQFLRRF